MSAATMWNIKKKTAQKVSSSNISGIDKLSHKSSIGQLKIEGDRVVGGVGLDGLLVNLAPFVLNIDHQLTTYEI